MADQLLIDTSGNVVPVPEAQVGDALSLGFVPASDKQIQNYNLTQQYSTPGQALLTGVESAGSALTLGGSSWLERAAGVDPQAMAMREKANPTASMIGTTVGIAAPLLLTGGLAAPEEAAGQGLLQGAAKLTAPSLLARAGGATAEAVGDALPQASSLIGKIGTAIAPAAAGSAIEGAGYGLGQVVHESALGDPALTAESALAQVGLSTLMGGALGGVTGIGHDVLDHLAGKAAANSTAYANTVSDWLDWFEASRNIKAAGGIQSDITRLVKQKGWDNLGDIARGMRDEGLLGIFSRPQTVYDRADALMDEVGPKLREVLEKADQNSSLSAGATGWPSDMPSWIDILAQARKEILGPRQEQFGGNAAAKTFSDMLDDWESKMVARNNAATEQALDEGMPEDFVKQYQGKVARTDLHDLRKQVDDLVYGMRGTQDPIATPLRADLSQFRGIVSDSLEDSLTNSETKDATLFNEWKSLNRRYEIGATARDLAEKGILRSEGNNFVSPTELVGGLAGLAGHGFGSGLLTGAAVAGVRRFGSSLAGAGARALSDSIESGTLPGALGGVASRVGTVGTAAANVAPHVALGVGSKLLAPATDVANQTGDLIQQSRLNGQPDTVARQATSDPSTINALATFERNNQAMLKTISDYCDQLIEGGKTATAQAIDQLKPDEFKTVSEGINSLVNQPNVMLDHMARTIPDTQDHAPQTAQALQVTLATALGFLQSKLPVRPQNGMLAAPWQPSKAEMGKFNRYWRAVNDPMSVIRSPTPEGIETLQSVYPKLLQQTGLGIMNHLSGMPAGKRPSYQIRLRIGALTGQDVDGTIKTAASMMASGAIPKPKPMMPKPIPGAGKLTLAERTSLAGETTES